MSFCLQNYYRYFSDIKPETIDKRIYKEGLKFIFIEDYSSDIDSNSDLIYKLNLQFFRIIQAIKLKENSYHFICTKDFKYGSDYVFKKIVVFGKDSFKSLETNKYFINYLNKYGSNCIDVLPSSFEMYTNPLLKKEAWDKLKRIMLY